MKLSAAYRIVMLDLEEELSQWEPPKLTAKNLKQAKKYATAIELLEKIKYLEDRSR